MATYDLEEQEQLDELKTWWKQHGDQTMTVIAVLSVVVLAWQGWNFWQRSQTSQAGVLYASLQQAANQGDAKRSRELAGELVEKFSSTAYAEMGVLVAARVLSESGDSKNARLQLGWAAEKANEPGMRELARLRLAALQLDEKLFDEALKTLTYTPAKPFKRRFAELRGDVLAAQGKTSEARAAYDEALAAGAAQPKDAQGRGDAAYADMIQAKREALALATPAAPPTQSTATTPLKATATATPATTPAAGEPATGAKK